MSDDQYNIEDKQDLRKEIREYAEKRVELFVITISEQISLMIAHSFQRFLGFLILAAGFLFVWFALGYLLGELIGSIGGGFAISALPLLIFGFIFSKRKSKRFTEKIQAVLMSKVLENFDKEEDESDGENGEANRE
ncbi:MAG: hypothetical protein EA359_12570 [Balneolaceae bacterium]|nr:MAG: hypothetical protein EA359_12570 [Balneolaceae bacterium]